MNAIGINFDSIINVSATTALAFTLLIPILQLDSVAKEILSPDRLHTRRRSESLYHLESSIKASNKKKKEFLAKNNSEKHGEDNGRNSTEAISSESDIRKTIKEILEKDEYPDIVAIEGDEDEEHNFSKATKEIYLLLSLAQGKRTVRVPLIPFCVLLSEAFGKILTRTGFCFIAEASAGLGPRLLSEVLKSADVGVALVSEPSWMLALASLIKQRKVNGEEKLKKIAFSLCRLEAWRVRSHVGDSRTVAFFLPGQSSTSSLLKLFHSTFPHERHVFAYDGCVSSLIRASSNYSKIPVSAPITPMHLPNSNTFYAKLAKLSSKQAHAVESWMSSVSAFLSMKEEESNNGYLPFVCRLGFLLGRTNGIGDSEADLREVAVTNVLQYMTGARSRPLKESVKQSAVKALKEFCEKEEKIVYPKLSEKQRIVVEDCVFCHKGILIGDKTLLDTVQPKLDWSLKAAKKMTTCPCCLEVEEVEQCVVVGAANSSLVTNGFKEIVWKKNNWSRILPNGSSEVYVQ